MDFPRMARWKGDVYEWIMHENDPAKKVDWILHFARCYNYDKIQQISEFDELFPYAQKPRCECGALHTSFPQFHMTYCPEFNNKDEEEDPEPFEDW